MFSSLYRELPADQNEPALDLNHYSESGNLALSRWLESRRKRLCRQSNTGNNRNNEDKDDHGSMMRMKMTDLIYALPIISLYSRCFP
jgi:hypothetical protein